MGSLFSSCYAKIDPQAYALGLLSVKTPDISIVKEATWKLRGVYDKTTGNKTLILQFICLREIDASTFTEEYKIDTMNKLFGHDTAFIASIPCRSKTFLPPRPYMVNGEQHRPDKDHFGIWMFTFSEGQPIPTPDGIGESFLVNTYTE